jgi:hypothetical protein
MFCSELMSCVSGMTGKETEEHGGTLLQCHSGHHRFHTWLDPGWNPGRGGGKPENNRLSYSTLDKVRSEEIQRNTSPR